MLLMMVEHYSDWLLTFVPLHCLDQWYMQSVLDACLVYTRVYYYLFVSTYGEGSVELQHTGAMFYPDVGRILVLAC